MSTWHPVTQAAEAAKDRIRNAAPISGDDLQKRVRVEMTPSIEWELRRHYGENPQIFFQDEYGYGPIRINGTSYYVVPRLPNPGWRIIA